MKENTMKKLSNKISIIAIMIAFGLAAISSTSFACGNYWMGYGANTSSAITVEQQQKLDAVKEKYSKELDALQSSLDKKANEYSNALTDESTTVGTLSRLDAERVDLERQYFTLLDKANNEAGVYVQGSNGPWFDCNYEGCNHQNHMGSYTYGRHMGTNYPRGMHGNHMAGCW